MIPVSALLDAVDELIAQRMSDSEHPLYALACHALRYGTTRSSGKRPYVSEMVGHAYEAFIDIALERMSQKEV